MEQKFKIFHEYVFIVFITLYISNETWIGATFILRLAFSAYPNLYTYYLLLDESVGRDFHSKIRSSNSAARLIRTPG